MTAEKKTLSECMPYEFMSGTYDNSPSHKYANLAVVKQFGYERESGRWPGTHRNVYNWVLLENGMAVGWNESPKYGWSFPLASAKAVERAGYKV